MTDKEVYQKWFAFSRDRRYLRPKRWDEIKRVINNFDVKTVLEFGAGVSTLLFDSINIHTFSVEQNAEYAKSVELLCSNNVTVTSDKEQIPKSCGLFDLSLVDGDLPIPRLL